MFGRFLLISPRICKNKKAVIIICPGFQKSRYLDKSAWAYYLADEGDKTETIYDVEGAAKMKR